VWVGPVGGGGGLGCLQVEKGGYLRSGKHPAVVAPYCDEGGDEMGEGVVILVLLFFT
jgi:hypothetical protein